MEGGSTIDNNDPTFSSVVVLIGFVTFLFWWWYSGRDDAGKSNSGSHKKGRKRTSGGRLRSDAYSIIDIETIAKGCKESNQPWKDPNFGHDQESLGLTLELRDGERGKLLSMDNTGVSWQLPGKFCKTSRPLGIRGDDGVPTWLYSDEDGDGIVTAAESMNLTDATQGSVGNCYFLSALAAVVQRHPDICDDLIDETYEEQGIYGVSFWVHGKWRMVWVDSYFPCYRPKKSRKHRLVFAGATDQKEIWPLVIEKAFAKLNGSYEAISGGHVGEALVLLTGGKANRYHPTMSEWNRFYKDVQEEEVLVGAGSQQLEMDPTQAAQQQKQLQGIITGHAYTVTNVYENNDEEDLKLVELRNPWGRGEWKGDWGQGSKMWNGSEQGRAADNSVGARRSEPGRFWMTYEDFCQCFTSVDTCTIKLSDEDKARRKELAEIAARIVAEKDRPKQKTKENNSNRTDSSDKKDDSTYYGDYTQESADAMMELLIAEEAREKRKKTIGARGNKRKSKKKHN